MFYQEGTNMIVVMKPHASEQSVNKVTEIIRSNGMTAHLSAGKEVTIIGVVGDKTKLDIRSIQAVPEVEKIVNITESYKLANIKFHPPSDRKILLSWQAPAPLNRKNRS